MEKNAGISIIRVLAMFSIILTHWCKLAQINDYQLFSIGVEIFLFISGYLYGQKAISNKTRWIAARIKRLMLPYWMLLFLIVGVRVLFDKYIYIKNLVLNLFCLQGINRILIHIDTGSIEGYGQTWFLTILWVNYFAMLLLKVNKPVDDYLSNRLACLFCSLVILQIVMAFCGVQLVYIICYFMGYFLSRKEWLNKKNYALITCLFIVLSVVRLVLRNISDGTVLYDHIIARWSFVAMAIWIIMTLLLICNRYKRISEKIVQGKVWSIIDYLSYPLFLSHYVFLSGDLSVEWLGSNLIIQTLIFAIFTVLLSIIIAFATDWTGACNVFLKKLVT